MKRYRLRLSYRQSWELVASGESRLWLGELAAMMQLKTCSHTGSPRLIVSKLRPKGKGWKACDLKPIRLWFHCSARDVICQIQDEKDSDSRYLGMWQAVYPIYERALNAGGFPFHAGLIERNGIGYLLAAPGGRGKSTCCSRLPPPWKALCDDESLIVCDNKRPYQVHPFPTMGDYLYRRSKGRWNVQQHLPLGAVFFLEQSKTDKVLSLGEAEAAILIYQSAIQTFYRSWDYLSRERIRVYKRRLFENACGLSKAVPAFILRASLYGRFWDKIEKVIC